MWKTVILDKDRAVHITDRPELVWEQAGEDACILLCLTEENRGKWWSGIRYAVEKPEEADPEFLERVYRRHVGQPWDILCTSRLRIREMTETDLDALYRIHDQPGTEGFLDGLPEDREAEREIIRSYIEGIYSLYGFGIWMLEERESGRCLGRAGFQMRDTAAWPGELLTGQGEFLIGTDGEDTEGKAGFDCPELGFIVEKDAQRKGYCEEACRALLTYGFRELEFDRIQALAAEDNLPSLCLCRKLGGRPVQRVRDPQETAERGWIRFIWDREEQRDMG